MSTPRRIILYGVIGFVGLCVLAAAVLLFLVDTEVYKARLEAAASRASGMEVSVGGRLGVAVFPRLLLTLEDVHVRDQGVEVASAKEARVAIGLLPVLKRQLRVEKIALKSPTISIETGGAAAAAATLPELDWPNVTLSDATINYSDKQSGDALHGAACSGDIHGLRYPGGKFSDLLKRASFTAQLVCTEVRSDGFAVSELALSAEAANGVLDLKPVTTRVFGTRGTGSVHAEFSGAVPSYQVSYSLLQFPIEEFFKTRSLDKLASGRMDFSADLSMRGVGTKAMRQSMKGQVSLRGTHLTLQGSDLDQQISRFESSQNFNLLDVGAFFFAGPLGLAVTKGYDFATIAQGQGGSSTIRTLVSDWRVERGVAQAQDVAMATRENRIALQGGLDFVNDRFDGVTVAVIDAKGCATVRQKISGTFGNPVVEQPNLLRSLTGPARRLLQKGGELFGGGQCDVFYAGAVAAPR